MTNAVKSENDQIGRAGAPSPVISSQVANYVVSRLRDRGVRVSAGLQKHTIDESDLLDRNAFIPLVDYVQFLETMSEQMNDPYLGLHMSLGNGPESVGTLGFLFMSARNLQHALETLQRHTEIVQEATHTRLELHEDRCFLSYRILDDSIYPRRQDTEYSVGFMHQLMQIYTNNVYRPLEIHFEHDRPSNLRTAENFFRCPVYYLQDMNCIVFDKSILSYESKIFDQALFPILEDHLRVVAPSQPKSASFSARVRGVVRGEHLERRITVKCVAHRLGISTATLQRRLQEEDTSFRKILNDRQFALAKRYFNDSDLSIGQVAFKVGFSDHAAFTRAFKRWSGVSPKDFKRSGAGRQQGEHGDKQRTTP